MAPEPGARERIAREALLELAREGEIGELLEERVEAEGVVTLAFAANLPGYPGWRWTVSLAELPDAEPTVMETELLPGEGALLAPEWVPWSKRLEEYRAAQAAAGQADETLDASDDDGDDDRDDDADDVDDGDFGIDLEDGIDFEAAERELRDASAVPAMRGDEEDESEADPDDDGPEEPAEA